MGRKFSNLFIGDSLEMLPGCNRLGTTGDCKNLFVEIGTGRPNIVNFGGQEHIPLLRPILQSSQFY